MIDHQIPALKRQLADEILRIADQTNFFVAAMVFGIGAPRLSDLRRGRIERFSVERLIRLLAVVDRRVELNVRTIGAERVRWFGNTAASARLTSRRRARAAR